MTNVTRDRIGCLVAVAVAAAMAFLGVGLSPRGSLWAQEAHGPLEAPQTTPHAEWSTARPFGEFTRRFYGDYFVSYVVDESVDVHIAPRRSAEVVGRLERGDHVVVSGISAQADTIEGRTASWLRVSFRTPLAELRNQPDSHPRGWVFGATIDWFADGDRRRTSPPLPRSRGPFVWTTGAEGFRYTDVPGTYVWLPGADEAQHLTYRGEIIEATTPTFSHDYRYMIENFGTGPGLRGFAIIELSTDDVVAEGSYLGRFSFDGTTVQTAFAIRDDGHIGPETPPEVHEPLAACVATLARPTRGRTVYGLFRFNVHTREYSLIDCTTD